MNRRSKFESLEGRRLLAAPIVGGPNYAAATDTYDVSVNNGGAATIPIDSVVTGVAWGMQTPLSTSGGASRTTFNAFTVTMPSGPGSLKFFEWLHTGRTLQNVQIDSLSVASGPTPARLRESWLLQNVNVIRFANALAPDGTPLDVIDLSLTQITISYPQYNAGNQQTGTTSYNWNLPTNSGTTTTTPFASNDLFTGGDVLSTLEYGAGQMPVGDAAISFTNTPPTGGGGGSGRAVAAGLMYSVVDGVASLPLLGLSSRGLTNSTSVYTVRSPITGYAAQRYRFGTVNITDYAFTDSAYDGVPRTATFKQTASQYQLNNYAYSGADNAVQTATSYGWNYTTVNAWTVASNSSHVGGVIDEARNTPVGSVTFQFVSPVTLTLANFAFDGLSGATLSGSGTTWTVGNLAPSQGLDGRYAVKLLADKVNTLASAGGSILIGSSGKAWTLDRAGPALVATAFRQDGPNALPFNFDFQLSERVTASATDGTAPILIRRADNNALVTTASGVVDADGVTIDASLAAVLADGRYRATLPAGSVGDAAGNVLAADQTLSFFILAGDANRDATVDFDDLLILAQNYGQGGRTFAQGNFNYSADGSVDFDDLLMLAQRYGTTLATQALPAAAAPKARASAAQRLKV